MFKFKILILFIFIMFFWACGNPYKKYFISVNEQNLASNYRFPTVALQKNEIPKLYTAEDMYAAEEALLENGYILVGSSKFKSPFIDKQRALDFAKELGASIVVVRSKHTATITETIPFSVRQPDQRTTVRETRYNTEGKSSIREQTITVEGEYQTTYVQKSTDYYDYQATFWAKFKDPKLGVFLTDLSNEQKYQLQTNRGVVVRIIIKDTPAFLADVLRGDIFTYFNEERINDRKHFFKMLAQSSGQDITLQGFRNTNPLTIKVKLK